MGPVTRLAAGTVLLAGLTGLTACAATSVAPRAAAPDAPDAPVLAEVVLHDAGAAAGVADLPAPLLLDDLMGTAHVVDLPAPLAVDGTPVTGGYRAGDVAYWSDGPRLVVFQHDGAALPARGTLTLVGRVVAGADRLAGCARDCAVAFRAGAGGERP